MRATDSALERESKLVRAVVAIKFGEREAASENGLDFGRCVASKGADGRDGRGQALAGDSGRVRTSEGKAPGDRLVKGHRQRVHIRARIRRCTLEHFGREIGDGPEYGASLSRRERAGDGLGHAEVRELRDTLLGDEDVLGFDVAMDNALFVGVVECFSDLLAVADGVGLIEPALRFENLAEGVAVDVLHDQVLASFDSAGVVDSDDVRVLEAGDDSCFSLEAVDEVIVVTSGHAITQDFHRDPAIEALIVREPDLSDAADS
jgi:hypothetical protein